jgi:Carboxypeptidase regulatory-like domain
MKDLEAFGNCRSTAEFLRWENGGDKVNSKLHIRIPIGLQLNLKCLWEKSIFRHRQRRLCSPPVQATCTEFLRSIGVALAFATLSLQTGESAAFAQATSGITRSLLAGTVVSSSGHPISAAILILQTNDGRIVAKGESDVSGHFRFGGVPAGEYIIVANKEGFDTAAESFVVRSRSGLPRLVLQMEADDGATGPPVGG